MIFVISDIHGSYDSMIEALYNEGYDKDNPSHLLICLGDLFDRGCQNLKVLEFFESISNKIMVRGNHDDMLVDIIRRKFFRRNNFINNTDVTINEFFGSGKIDMRTWELDIDNQSAIARRLCDFIANMRDYYETDNYIFVHGWVPNVKVSENNYAVMADWRRADNDKWRSARWDKWWQMYDKCDRPSKTIVCGHASCHYASLVSDRSDDDYSVYKDNGIIAIDGSVYKTDKLNVLLIDNP